MSIKEVNEKCWYKDFCSLKNEGDGCHMCTKYFKINYFMTHSNLPPAKQKPIKLSPTTDHDIETFKKLDDIRLNIYEFVYYGKNLFIGSDNTGNGKTSWAIKLLHKYIEEVWEQAALEPIAQFIHVPTLLLELKDFNNPLPRSAIQTIKECDLVVWDDIGDARLSDYDYNQLLSLIDYRTLAEKSNIYTSNITSYKKLIKLVGERIASRIYDGSKVILLDGGDNRDGRVTDTE